MLANSFPLWNRSLIVRGQSFTPIEGQANVKSWWHSSLQLRFIIVCSRKKEYSELFSVNNPLPVTLVSVRAAMSILYLASSEVIRAVRLWGLSVSPRSISMRTLHAVMFSAGHREVEQVMFEVPFLARSTCCGRWAVLS